MKRLLGRWDLWDETQVYSKIHFIPRRGPAKLVFPLPVKKALILLTGRKTFRKAKESYRFYLQTRQKAVHFPRNVNSRLLEDCDEDWSKEKFMGVAEDYVRYPRKGFDRAKQEKRLSKVFRKLGVKSA